MIKLTKGQVAVLTATSVPMAAVGVAGAVATYSNMKGVLGKGEVALGMVAIGEGGTLVAALIALAVTLMGQHTPAVVRAAMWLIPLVASGTGLALAKDHDHRVVMAVTPLAMTVAGEGIAFVARRMVAYRTGVDLEQQRRSGLLLWHANRAANGRGLGKVASKAAVWRLTKAFAATDSQLSVQLGEIQRYRIGQGADSNLAAVLTGETRTGLGPKRAPEWALEAPQTAAQPTAGPIAPARYAKLLDTPSSASEGTQDSFAGATKPIPPSQPPQAFSDALKALADRDAERFGVIEHFQDELALVEDDVRADPDVKLLTTAEVAALKGVQPGTVRSWKHRKKLPFTLVEGVPMFHPLDVANLD